MIPVMYGNNYQIIQAPGYVVITYEIVHEARVIPLDGRSHVGAGVRAHMGDPRGRWDGNTLVVETTNFTSTAAYRNANAETFKVVERFTRVAPDRIEWTATLDDPKTWTRPWTIAMPLTADPQSDLPLRVPRAQLRTQEYSQRGTRGRTNQVAYRVGSIRRVSKTRLYTSAVTGPGSGLHSA